MASSPPVQCSGTTRARKNWEFGDRTANLKLPPLGIPPRLGGRECQMTPTDAFDRRCSVSQAALIVIKAHDTAGASLIPRVQYSATPGKSGLNLTWVTQIQAESPRLQSWVESDNNDTTPE
jgi:hypothetical protein